MKYYNLLIWKINYSIDQNPSYQIQEFIIEKIKKNEIKHGDRLLSQREFSKLNHINSNTVKRAYETLAATGWVTSVIGSGTFVSANINHESVDFITTGFGDQLPLKLKPIVPEDFKILSIKQYFLGIGLDMLSPAFYPGRLMLKYMRYHSKQYQKITQVQQMADLRGVDFKNAIRQYLNSLRGFRLNEGCLETMLDRRECLNRIFQLLLSPGDVAVNTAPQDIPVASTLAEFSSNIYNLSTVSELDFINDLKSILKKTKIKVLYISPQCGYPEGNVLSEDTCIELLELAKEHEFYLVEEDDYHEFWYNKLPYRLLSTYDHDGHVIYTGGLSQLSHYMQSTRIIAACKPIITMLNTMPPPHNLCRSLIEERATIEILNSGELYHLVKKARIAKEKDRDNLAWTLRNYLDRYIDINIPDSGLSFWLKFPDYLNVKEAMGLLEEQDVEVPVNPYLPPNYHVVHYMRLGFGTFDMKEAENAAKVLAAKFEEYYKS